MERSFVAFINSEINHLNVFACPQTIIWLEYVFKESLQRINELIQHEVKKQKVQTITTNNYAACMYFRPKKHCPRSLFQKFSVFPPGIHLYVYAQS